MVEVNEKSEVRSDVGTQNQEPTIDPKKITAKLVLSLNGEALLLQTIFPEDAPSLKVSLHNLLGRQIRVHPTRSTTQGEQTFRFETRRLPNGPYFVVLEANGQRLTKKIMLSR